MKCMKSPVPMWISENCGGTLPHILLVSYNLWSAIFRVSEITLKSQLAWVELHQFHPIFFSELLLGGFKHVIYFPYIFHKSSKIWDVIRNPAAFHSIFQDGHSQHQVRWSPHGTVPRSAQDSFAAASTAGDASTVPASTGAGSWGDLLTIISCGEHEFVKKKRGYFYGNHEDSWCVLMCLKYVFLFFSGLHCLRFPN